MSSDDVIRVLAEEWAGDVGFFGRIRNGEFDASAFGAVSEATNEIGRLLGVP